MLMKSLVKTILGPERSERVARALRGVRASTPIDSATLHREVEAVRVALGHQLAARQAERLADRRDAADQTDAVLARLEAIDAKVDALAEHVRTITADLAGRVADLDAERRTSAGL
jgi:HD superfamily phosphodiesterase